MAQVKVYALGAQLEPIRQKVSDAVHACLVEVLGLPEDKRFQRFILLEADDFIYPATRSDRYTILELLMFEGRSAETKKTLIQRLMACLHEVGIPVEDIEITLLETPRHTWGIRGQTGDELALTYRVET